MTVIPQKELIMCKNKDTVQLVYIEFVNFNWLSAEHKINHRVNKVSNNKWTMNIN